MAVIRSELFQSGLALLVWFQEIETSVGSKYDVDFTAMKYIAASLSSRECYDFYHLLSHRRATKGRTSIYAEKEKAQEISCMSLLATWLTDPSESAYRTNENIELKLRAIGRKDLARWMLSKIDSSLKRRRRLNVDEIDQQYEETELRNGVVRNRTGNRIIPSPSVGDQSFVTNYDSTEERQASCVFWKVFFSCLVVLLLIILILCFYKFVYTKLRCICQRFNNVDDEECCLPEQKYGTTSSSNPQGRASRKRRSDNSKTDEISRENLRLASERFSSTTETNDEMFSTMLAEKRSLLLNNASKLTKISATNARRSSSTSKNVGSTKFSSRSREFVGKSEKTMNSAGKEDRRDDREVFDDFEKIQDRPKRRNEICEKSMEIDGRKSENLAAESKSSARWVSCSCNLIEKSSKKCSASSATKSESKSLRKSGKTMISPCESSSGLSETYDELGMLFSQHLKLQWKACERKYCALTRNLGRGKVGHHDVRKCRNRGRIRFYGDKIMMKWDERPACSSGNICRETYDEYEIMKSTREERRQLARSIVQRRKSFLDQPCLSPLPIINHS